LEAGDLELLRLVSGFWQWLEDASQGQATFSSVGLIALLLREVFMQSAAKGEYADVSLMRRIRIPANSVGFTLKKTRDAMAALDRAIADLETKSSARESAEG
jgi:hypothetical protein